ncbi:hypothetical protein ACJX0J_021911 [Zea mays]
MSSLADYMCCCNLNLCEAEVLLMSPFPIPCTALIGFYLLAVADAHLGMWHAHFAIQETHEIQELLTSIILHLLIWISIVELCYPRSSRIEAASHVSYIIYIIFNQLIDMYCIHITFDLDNNLILPHTRARIKNANVVEATIVLHLQEGSLLEDHLLSDDLYIYIRALLIKQFQHFTLTFDLPKNLYKFQIGF